ncbi:MAG TPA: rhomboid family intramembrane serine protease [Anaerolineales bacterium]|nr:rhomboid family intramembrane serine protease [Anaerolineales bacterium]
MNSSPAPAPASESTLGRLRWRAPATLGLMALTGVVFAAQLAATLIAGTDVVLILGMKDRAALEAGQMWRLISPIFIHGGFLHLMVNMYSFYALGPAVEHFFGSQRLVAVYLLSGVTGIVLSLAMNPRPSVGASGAIFGLLGALGVFIAIHRRQFGPGAQAQLRQIGVVLALNLVISLTPGIDAWGHLGGLVAGAGSALLFGPRLEIVPTIDGKTTFVDRRRWVTIRSRALGAAIGLLALAAFVLWVAP